MSDPDFTADQPKLTAIEQTYRDGNNELPSPELDDAVLAHARAAASNRRRQWTSPRWIMGLATAAAVLLTVSVYRNIELEADLAGDLPQQSEARAQPRQEEPASELTSTLDDSNLRDAGAQETPANEEYLPPSTAPVKPAEAVVSVQPEVPRPAAKQSNAPIAVGTSAADADAAPSWHRMRSQLGLKSAAAGAVAQDTEVAQGAAEFAESRLQTHSISESAQLTCSTPFTFPQESREHVVAEDRVSYRLHGTLHTWRCKDDVWEAITPESDQ